MTKKKLRNRILPGILAMMPGLFLGSSSFAQYIHYSNSDPRQITNGVTLPSGTYADQPYVIVCDDGSWLCTITTSSGTEQAYMDNIISTKSYDQGKTWTTPIPVEAPGVPQSSWAVPLKIPGGRIYLFYNYNLSGFTGVEGVMSGPFMYKYSDDHGKTWSADRYEAPVRRTTIDRENYTNGKTCFFWSIDKPVVTDKAVYIAFSKILRESPDQPEFYKRSEGFILSSQNILWEKDPEKIKWLTLPDGESGIWNPQFGKVQAEHNSVILNNGNIYVVYRTIDGSPAYSISTDNGRNFSMPRYMHYASGGRMGNPRACPKIHKTADGRYLFWFHNNFGQNTYDGRNPAWLSGGIEKNGDIRWSQPEIVLYDNDPEVLGMSYPDFIEQDGRLWLTETQKTTARVHGVDPGMIRGMWSQGKVTTPVKEGLIMNSGTGVPGKNQIAFPRLPDLSTGGGFSLELWLTVHNMKPGQQLLTTFGSKHKGIEVFLAGQHAIGIRIADGEVRVKDLRSGQEFLSDANTVMQDKLHHVMFIIDGASKIASVVVDGILSDGSVDTRPCGWGRIHPHMKDMNDTYHCSFNPSFDGEIHHIRVYDRYLRTSEAIANYHAGMPY